MKLNTDVAISYDIIPIGLHKTEIFGNEGRCIILFEQQTKNPDMDIPINEYVKLYPPYHTAESLGVNVSEIMKIAKKYGKEAKDLTVTELSLMTER